MRSEIGLPGVWTNDLIPNLAIIGNCRLGRSIYNDRVVQIYSFIMYLIYNTLYLLYIIYITFYMDRYINKWKSLHFLKWPRLHLLSMIYLHADNDSYIYSIKFHALFQNVHRAFNTLTSLRCIIRRLTVTVIFQRNCSNCDKSIKFWI